MTLFTSPVTKAIAAVGLALLLAGPVFGGEDREDPVTAALWEALGAAWPERLTLRARWVTESDALFEAPVVSESERIGVQQLISCTRRGRWVCQLSDPELHIEANGTQHRTRARNVARDDVVKIVDYVYSACFNAQQTALGWKPHRSAWGFPYQRNVYDIADLGGGLFEVATGGWRDGRMYRIEADPGDKGCAFQLRGGRGWSRRPG